MLQTADSNLTLHEIVNSSVSTRTVSGQNMPSHFFEVELVGIVRHKNDTLLSATAIYNYLAEIAPVPFFPDFTFREKIASALSPHVALGELQIRIQGVADQCTDHIETKLKSRRRSMTNSQK